MNSKPFPRYRGDHDKPARNPKPYMHNFMPLKICNSVTAARYAAADTTWGVLTENKNQKTLPSDEHFQIVTLIGRGFSPEEIGRILHKSEKYIRERLITCFRIAGVNTSDYVLLCVYFGVPLIPPPTANVADMDNDIARYYCAALTTSNDFNYQRRIIRHSAQNIRKMVNGIMVHFNVTNRLQLVACAIAAGIVVIHNNTVFYISRSDNLKGSVRTAKTPGRHKRPLTVKLTPLVEDNDAQG